MTSLHHLIAASFWRSHATPVALDPFGRTDPGMRVTERADLIRAGLPIDEDGNAIVETDDV